MPLKKLLFKPGVNRENTRYTTEGGYYECDKIRFRQGTPEKIGGWQRISNSTFLGICRSLWSWITLDNVHLTGVGTNKKFYVQKGGVYYDITPVRAAVNLTNPFTATLNSDVITVYDADHGCVNGDYVTFDTVTGLGGNVTAAVLTGQFEITFLNPNQYTIRISVQANATAVAASPGGAARAVYQINTGPDYQVAINGWGGGPWGYGTWGNGIPGEDSLRLWSQSNYGQDLVFGPRGGGIYYWSATYETQVGVIPSPITIANGTPGVITLTTPLTYYTTVMLETSGSLPTGLETGVPYYVRNFDPITNQCNLSATPDGALITISGTQTGNQYLSPRAVLLQDLAGAKDVPTIQNFTFVSDIYRFVFAFGCNDYGSAIQNPVLIRWSDQESAVDWTPSATNQAGSLPLSHGSAIITAQQTRQEIVVWTDSAVYSLQYLGAPLVWSATLLADNTSIVGQNAVATASGITYWMGVDKFYKYDGRVQTMRCDLRQYIFQDFNALQPEQVFAGTNEGFNEVWWFYCSANSVTVDKYVVYNYAEDIWYYGTMARTAWLDNGINEYPLAATYTRNLVNHEVGVDDQEGANAIPIPAYILTSQFDIDDGHNFGFIWRILPDLTFRGSSNAAPQATMSLYPLQNSGSGYNVPPSVGGVDYAAVTRTATVPIEQFTGQIYVRVRGRQMAFKIESDQLGTTWQLGAPRIDIKSDGRR